jgi:hypothetical protein
MHRFCFMYIALIVATIVASSLTYVFTTDFYSLSDFVQLLNPYTTNANDLTSVGSALSCLWVTAAILAAYVITHLVMGLCHTAACSRTIGLIGCIITAILNVWLLVYCILIFVYYSNMSNTLVFTEPAPTTTAKQASYIAVKKSYSVAISSTKMQVTTLLTGVLGVLTCVAFFTGCFAKTHRFNFL